MPLAPVSHSETIQASPEAIYELISDITRTGEWSPENTGGRWLGGAGRAKVGARFVGSNHRGWRRWWTVCTVTEAEPGRRFTFEVAFAVVPISRWSYELSPSGSSTVVTETWTDRRPTWFARTASPLMGTGDLRAHQTENIRTTLTNLKQVAESN